ncbi:hypothetical protein ATI61_108184 [Archangium gephyra]|uniref:PIN domain-containing protein n=1 Tax=Archangium gephyra TaxID=48 RepID=A0ABX9JWW5_9BACT|nr:hypothetical protein [Archangium gephyra]REG28646.1 hypothetical protein ATI61_108184 [Archangium gephyra]
MQNKKLLEFRSNDLRHLTGGPELPGLKAPPPVISPIFALVDTNVVLSTISCRAQLKNPLALTNLEEAVNAGVLRAFATTLVKEEVIRNLPTFPCKAPSERIESAKQAILEKIYFFEPSDRKSVNIQRLLARDPTDVPHAQLFEELGLDVIISRDNDWNETDYPRLGLNDADLVRLLREYARAAVKHAGMHSLVSTGTMLTAATIKGAFEGFANLSTPMKWFAGLTFGGLAVATLCLASTLEEPPPESQKSNPEWPFKTFFDDLRDSGEKSAGLSAQIERLLERQKKLTLKQHLLRIFCLADEPLALHEIAQQLQRAGHKSRAQNPSTQLRRALGGDKKFALTADGRWQFSAQIKIEETEHAARLRELRASLRRKAQQSRPSP